MSAIIAAVIEDGQVGYVLADSLAYLPGADGWAYVPKVVTCPHARTVLAARGNVAAMNSLFPELTARRSLDDIVAVICDWLPAAYSSWRAGVEGEARLHPDIGPPRVDKWLDLEVFALGWSDDRARMRLCAATSYGKQSFVLRESDGPFFAPMLPAGDEALSPSPVLSLHNWMLRAMRRQRVVGRAQGRELIGGPAIFTTVTRDKIEQRILADLETDEER